MHGLTLFQLQDEMTMEDILAPEDVVDALFELRLEESGHTHMLQRRSAGTVEGNRSGETTGSSLPSEYRGLYQLARQSVGQICFPEASPDKVDR